MRLESGVYIITNNVNKKIYIGSCINFYKRYHNHKSKLRRNVHPNKHLQSAWNKYGSDNFSFELVVKCPKEYCIKMEQWFLNNIKPDYNMKPTAGNSLGYKTSDEVKQKISIARKGYKMTQEHKDAISKANLGKKRSATSKDKMSKASLGKSKSLTARLNMSKSKLGKSLTRKKYNK